MQRVTCVVPIVMDLLHAVPNLHHFYRSLGGWPFTFQPYHRLNITRDLDTPAMAHLLVSTRAVSPTPPSTSPHCLLTGPAWGPVGRGTAQGRQEEELRARGRSQTDGGRRQHTTPLA